MICKLGLIKNSSNGGLSFGKLLDRVNYTTHTIPGDAFNAPSGTFDHPLGVGEITEIHFKALLDPSKEALNNRGAWTAVLEHYLLSVWLRR